MPKSVHYQKGSVVFFEGARPKHIFVLQEGIVEISRKEMDAKSKNVSDVKKGQFFGVKNMLVNTPYMSTAVAKEDSSIILLSNEEFEEFILKDNDLAVSMIKNISRQLYDTHAAMYANLNTHTETDFEYGLFSVAKGFYDKEEYLPFQDIADKYLNLCPDSEFSVKIKQMLNYIQTEVDLESDDKTHIILTDAHQANFSLPESFKRYEKSFPARKVIFSEFEKGDSFFMVQKGIVRSAKYINGININQSLATPGDFFGLNAFVGSDERDMTCITTDEVKVLEFAHADFENIIHENPKIAFMLLKLLSKRVYLDRKILKNSRIKNLHKRLLDMFAVLDEQGLCEKLIDGSRKINLSPTNIAVWTNVPEKDIIKELKFLDSERIIHLSDEGWLVVKDMEKVRAMANASYL